MLIACFARRQTDVSALCGVAAEAAGGCGLAACHYLQGYLFAKPMDADDLLRLIARWETRERPGPAAPSAAG